MAAESRRIFSPLSSPQTQMCINETHTQTRAPTWAAEEFPLFMSLNGCFARKENKRRRCYECWCAFIGEQNQRTNLEKQLLEYLVNSLHFLRVEVFNVIKDYKRGKCCENTSLSHISCRIFGHLQSVGSWWWNAADVCNHPGFSPGWTETVIKSDRV